jgi:DNA-binding transcriptional LysR family regulator
LVRRYYDLPSLTALATFEASARHRSFKLAAGELNVTPSAVSRQIKALEQEFGVPLFYRQPDGVELTPEGEELYAVLSSGFARASEVVHRIKTRNRARNVTLACTNAVAIMWLIPRMSEFWRQYPDLQIDHFISDNARDYRRADIDLRIRYGSGVWPDETATLLLKEWIYPVVGPGFAGAHAKARPVDIPSLPLLHVDWLEPDWTDWNNLLKRASIPHGPLAGRRFSSLSATLQAAQDDQGVALGWHQLVQPLLVEKRLVRFTDLTQPAPGSYYLTWNDNRELSEAAATLKAWLLEIAGRTGAPDPG